MTPFFKWLLGLAALLPACRRAADELVVAFDPEAAHVVLHAPWAKITSGGEITNRVVLGKELRARIVAVKTPVTKYLAKYAQLDVPL